MHSAASESTFKKSNTSGVSNTRLYFYSFCFFDSYFLLLLSIYVLEKFNTLLVYSVIATEN